MYRFALVTLPLLAFGCQTPCASTGWKFEVGKPTVVLAPALTQQNSGSLAVSSLAAYPAAPALQSAPLALAATAPCESGATRVASQGPVFADRAPGCGLADVCASLNRIERRLETYNEALNQPRKMPVGPAQAPE